jgi:heptaprenylglyceryl phosphate synthase
MNNNIYHTLTTRKQKGQKSFAVLIDPDKVDAVAISELVQLSTNAGVDYFLVGGDL